jgi:predicted Zn-dependent peptidase
MTSFPLLLTLAALAGAAGNRSIPSVSLPAAPVAPRLPALPRLPAGAQAPGALPSIPSLPPAPAAAAAPQAAAAASAPRAPGSAPQAPSAQPQAQAMSKGSESASGGHASVEASAAQNSARFDGSKAWQGLPVESFTLPNGLTVVVNSDHSAPMVAVSITYKVGSQDERPGRSGFAHLFEHLMAQGTKSLKPREISQLIESNGGARNAFTTRTNTTYHTLIPRGALDLVLWAEAERMHTLNVDARALALEQQVVLEEMRLRYDNAAYRRAQDQRMAETAFTKWENRHTTIGEAADVRDAQLQDVRDFYDSHYAPNNAVVALAGDITLDQAKALMAQYFGHIPAKPVPAPADLSEPPMLADQTARVEDPNAKTPRVMAAWHGPARDTKDFWALTALSQILSGDDENPLYQELVRKQPLALSAGTNFPWWTSHNMRRGNPELFGVIATPRPGVAAARLVEATRRLMEHYGSAGPSDEELARAKTGLERAWVGEMDFLLDRAQLMSTYAALVGPVQNLWADLRALLSVTAQDVKDAVRRWVAGKPVAVVEVVPGAPQAPKAVANPAVPEATPRPEGDPRPVPTATPAPAVPAIKSFSLSNGLQVVVVEDHKLPSLQVRLSLNGGRTSEGAGESGLSNAAAGLLLKGAAGLDAEQFAQKLAALGFELGASVGSESLRVDGNGLSRNAEAFFALLGQALSSPAYPDEELALWKQQALQRLKSLNNEPDFMAGERLKKELFPGHPYGKPYPQEAELQAVTPEALRRFHATRLAPRGATLTVAGDVDASALQAQLERALSGWTGGAAPASLPAVPAAAPAPITLVDRPGSTQANLVIAKALPLKSTDPDFLALQMANQLLGGSATSRLFLNLRVDKGYTYGSYSSLDPRSRTVVFTAEAQVRNEVAAPALSEMRKELARLRDQPVSAKELDDAKALLAGRFMMRLSSSDRFADWLAQVLKEGRDPSRELKTFLARLRALTPEDIQRVARKYLDPAGMATIAVGDAASIAGPLGAARP